MVQSLINLTDHENRVLTVVKGKFGLRNKSEAMKLIIDKYEKRLLEPELRPEYKVELKKIDAEKSHKFKNISDLRAEIEK